MSKQGHEILLVRTIVTRHRYHPYAKAGKVGALIGTELATTRTAQVEEFDEIFELATNPRAYKEGCDE